MVSELIQREKALVSLLKRKDAEIDDMRAGGAKVSRSKLVQILPLPGSCVKFFYKLKYFTTKQVMSFLLFIRSNIASLCSLLPKVTGDEVVIYLSR